MRIFTNRIVISLAVILAAAVYWEFGVRAVSSPLYRAAVRDYREGQFKRSLARLDDEEWLNSNNAAARTLMGWDLLKLREPSPAEKDFRMACRLAPHSSSALLGYIYAEISLQHYDKAELLLRRFKQQYGQTGPYQKAQEALNRELKSPEPATKNNAPHRGVRKSASGQSGTEPHETG
jgi:hypothetical protein